MKELLSTNACLETTKKEGYQNGFTTKTGHALFIR